MILALWDHVKWSLMVIGGGTFGLLTGSLLVELL